MVIRKSPSYSVLGDDENLSGTQWTLSSFAPWEGGVIQGLPERVKRIFGHEFEKSGSESQSCCLLVSGCGPLTPSKVWDSLEMQSLGPHADPLNPTSAL